MTVDTKFNRYCSLTLTNASNDVLELSDFRIQFHIKQSDCDTPNTAVIRVYNLSLATIQQLVTGFYGVILTAGYQENFGIVFLGNVKQYKIGKENNIDRYLDIFAADGDSVYTSGMMSTVIAPDTPAPAALQQMTANVYFPPLKNPQPVPVDPYAPSPIDNPFGGTLPRGKVVYGLMRTQLRQFSKTLGARWYFSNGRVVVVPNASYRDTGQIVVLTGETGLIGYPEATEQGIEFVCLIDPRIQIGGLAQLDNNLVQQHHVLAPGWPSWGSLAFPGVTSSDGLYRILALDYEGDTRGQPWYAKCVGLALNPDTKMVSTFDMGTP
jgi:hypothetical protein